MTFGSTFGRVLSPTFQPKSQAAVAGGGWWDLDGTITSCVAAYQAKGAASYAASKVNLANPGTYDAGEIAGREPAWDTATGWKGNGANDTTCKLLTTTIKPASTSWSVIARYSGAQNSNDAVVLVSDYSGGYRTWGLRFYHLSQYQRWHCGSENFYGQARTANGVMALAGTNAYQDGSLVGTVTAGTMPAANIYLLANPDGGGSNGFIGYVQAVAIYNMDISSYVSALTTAMNLL